MNGWTEERRARQRELIKRWRPWELSTGARTPKGKARSSKNAVKTGASVELRNFIKEMHRLLRAQKRLFEE
ncbi:hypothetical protein DCO16_07670 [Polynucleobacter antarcticus]|uniref:Uncharacterized protein n=1 Tax=Polynucleobacter antarcticus TaxID=1743162 RepID=A0A6M9PL54_9BURK|nr:hypothetical protein DCO16_07670 [Polynucleobacter antarcticus]